MNIAEQWQDDKGVSWYQVERSGATPLNNINGSLRMKYPPQTKSHA